LSREMTGELKKAERILVTLFVAKTRNNVMLIFSTPFNEWQGKLVADSKVPALKAISLVNRKAFLNSFANKGLSYIRLTWIFFLIYFIILPYLLQGRTSIRRF